MHPIKEQAVINSSLSREQGISLIEVLVSLLLFGVSVMGYSALQTRSMQESLDNQQRSVALWRANGLIDRMSANSSEAALTEYASSINGFDACANEPPADCAELGGAAASCDETEMAEFDVWSALCGVDGGTGRQLLDLTASLNCVGACAPGTDMTLTFNWIAKSIENNTDMTEDAAIEQVSLVFRP